MRYRLRIATVLLAAIAVAAAAWAREDHKAYRNMPLAECAECHQAESGIPATHGGGWMKEHRILAAGAGNNCYDCHDQGTCQDCHKGGGLDAKLSRSQWKRDIKPESHRSDWVSIHPIEAKGSPQSCARCHEPTFCSNCHGQVSKSSLTIRSHARAGATQTYIAAFPLEHAEEARRSLASCQSCHPDGDVCLTCHSAKIGTRVNPHPRDFKADRIRSKSNGRSCRVCHDF